MNPADRLRTAADRLEALDKAASGSPWKVIESHGRDYSGEGYSFVTLVMRESDDDVARWYGETDRETSDARLIATLRPLAPVLVKQLHTAIDRLAAECLTELDYAPWHEEGCGLDVGRDIGDAGSCHCFDDALAIADAVLAATGGAA